MADRYNHYGVEVLRQYTDSFRASLRRQGVEYTDLAVAPEIDVVTYDTVKGKRYAFIRPQRYHDDCAELVYITTQTPDDCDWIRLADDIDAQHNGAAPVQRRTRAKMLLETAERIYQDDCPAPANVFDMGAAAPDEKEMVQAIQVSLAGWGIDFMELKRMDHHDIDETFWNKVCSERYIPEIEVQSKK